MLRLRARHAGFDERLLEHVIAHPSVELASPRLSISAAVLDTGMETAPLLTIVGARCISRGRVVFESASRCRRASSSADSRFALIDDGIFLSPAALQKFRLAVGDNLRVQVTDRVVAIKVVGTVPGAGAEQLIGVMDLGFAQWRLDRLGTLTRIDLKLAPGTSLASVAHRSRCRPALR